MGIDKKRFEASFKSADTEEFLDIYFNRPIGYLWTLLFKRLGVHPNVVTVLSIFLGIGAGIMFYFPDVKHTLIGIFLLIWANHYDSCDGQLARLTGKKHVGDVCWMVWLEIYGLLRSMRQFACA